MITTNINHLCPEILHHLHYYFEEIRMFSFPFTQTAFLQMPSVNDISIQYQTVAIDWFKKTGYLLSFGVLGPQMNIREDNGGIIRA